MQEVQQIFISDYDSRPDMCIAIHHNDLFFEIKDRIMYDSAEFIREKHFVLYDMDSKHIAKVFPVHMLDLDSMIGRIIILADADGKPIYNNVCVLKAQVDKNRDSVIISLKPDTPKKAEKKNIETEEKKPSIIKRLFSKH